METKVWTEQDIVALLMKNDQAVARAVLALYARQTEDEQAGETTRHVNGRGFNSRDAAFMTSIAKALPKWNNRMTPRQLVACRKILPKYRRQLLEIAEERGATVNPKPKMNKEAIANTRAQKFAGCF